MNKCKSSSGYTFSFLLVKHLGIKGQEVRVQLCKELTFPKLYHYTPPPAMYKSSGCFTSSPKFGVSTLFNFSHSRSFNFYFFDYRWLWAPSPHFSSVDIPQDLGLGSFSTPLSWVGFSSGSGSSCMVLKIFAIKLEEMDQKVWGCSLHS